MFVLGNKEYNFEAITQDYKVILTLFNSFDQSSKNSIKNLISQFQFPFEYDETISEADNRLLFKDFFSCLTKIRCAVIEGSHRCESACRLLQGYSLGGSIPLTNLSTQLPPNSTIFKPVQTRVYYPKDMKMKLDKQARSELKAISKKISDLKKYIVKDTWSQWMTNVLDEIVAHAELQELLFDSQSEFFQENVYHRDIGSCHVRSNLIKKYLHDILTNACFEYNPCKELLFIPRREIPNRDLWSGNSVFWQSLNANPYSTVSEVVNCLFIMSFISNGFFSA